MLLQNMTGNTDIVTQYLNSIDVGEYILEGFGVPDAALQMYLALITAAANTAINDVQ
jgi:hypothetical protein